MMDPTITSNDGRAPPRDEHGVLFWLAVALFLLVMLALTIHSSLGAPLNLSSGTNYTFNYTNETNETASQEFVCLPNVTLPFSVNVSVVLSPGESRVTAQDACLVTATCAAALPNVTFVNGTCSVDERLDPGDAYSKHEGACNVDVRCRKDESSKGLTTTVQHTKHYKISGDGQTITFDFDGNTQPFSRNSTTFNYEADVVYQCPVEIKPETFEGDDLLQLCKETNPFLITWVDLALKRGYDCTDQKTACEESVTSCESQCTNRVGALNDRILTLQNNINSTTAAFNSCVEAKQVVESRQWLSVASLILLSLWAGMASVLAIILGVVLYRQRKNGGGGGEE